MSELNTGDLVSFNHKGKRSLGELKQLPENSPENVYEIEDLLLEDTVKVPSGTLVREAFEQEKFRVFVVQQDRDGWIDIEKFRLREEAKEFEQSLDESRIVSELIQL